MNRRLAAVGAHGVQDINPTSFYSQTLFEQIKGGVMSLEENIPDHRSGLVKDRYPDYRPNAHPIAFGMVKNASAPGYRSPFVSEIDFLFARLLLSGFLVTMVTLV